MKYTGAEILIELLERHGIKTIAGIPGGANLPIYHALSKSKIRHILTRHEQGAGFIAQGMARTTGKAAVCFATSGPGATNLLTAIADAKLDSIPVIAITGQVPLKLIGTDAFQEVDTYGMTLPITKHNFLIRDAEELFTVIPEAFRIAEEGRPGPVVIDIPKDIQKQQITFDKWPDLKRENKRQQIDKARIEEIAKLINESKRPLLYIGGGITSSGSHEMIYDLANKNSIPLTSTLMGLGCFPPDDPLFLGMLGMHGARYTNKILNEADLLLAFGVRFDDRATGKVEKFCPDARIIHIDIDHSEIDKIKKADLSLIGDINAALKSLLPLINSNKRWNWISTIEKIKQSDPFIIPEDKDPLNPLNIIKEIGRIADSDTIITTDVGQHQMWTAQIYPFRSPRTLLTSGGLGTMGFGMPAAIGAALAHPDRRIICISGDGSFLMNIQELATLSELNLNVTVLILDNGHLGLVRQQQEFFYEKNYMASKFDSNPDFKAIAQGFHIKSYDLGKEDDPADILSRSISEPGPCIVTIPIDHTENVTPMVPPGAGNHEMIGGEKNE
ncbi:MAG: biosynthetic-type acetolactate synthase large subunit [Spirochaetes bacterium]|nr:biosynthetic-type acetolactate synthase large subunit [Spirochaetota bacterium]